MFDLVHLGFLRQQGVEVTTQTSWILAIAVPAHPGPVQDPLDTTANPACCLRLGCPDWLQHLHHQAGVDGGHRQRAEHGVGIGLEGVGPLLAVLLVTPAGLVARNECLGALLERDSFCGRYEGSLRSEGKECRSRWAAYHESKSNVA